jgi:hypothetical protein
LGPLQASFIADTHKRKLIILLDRIRTSGYEEPAMSTHSMQAFNTGSFIRQSYGCCYYPLNSDKMSTLKCGKGNIGLLIELFL